MTGHDPLADLREQFRAAAARDVAAKSPSPRRRWTGRARAVAALVALGLGTAGVAAAIGLFPLGSERSDVVQRLPRYVPEGAPRVVLQVADPGGELPWGVANYTSATGERCAIVGHVQGATLGAIEGERFRPYAADTGGPCAEGAEAPFFADVRNLGERTLVYGRAADGITKMEVRHGSDRQVGDVGPGGAFLLVFDTGFPQSEVQLLPRTG